MSTSSIPAIEQRLQALHGLRCEDLCAVHEAMRSLLEQAKEVQSFCYVPRPGNGRSFCVLPEHCQTLAEIIDELEFFLSDEEEENV